MPPTEVEVAHQPRGRPTEAGCNWMHCLSLKKLLVQQIQTQKLHPSFKQKPLQTGLIPSPESQLPVLSLTRGGALIHGAQRSTPAASPKLTASPPPPLRCSSEQSRLECVTVQGQVLPAPTQVASTQPGHRPERLAVPLRPAPVSSAHPRASIPREVRVW